MKKSIQASAICLIASVALVACGNGTKNPEPSAGQQKAAAETAAPSAVTADAVMDKPMDGSSPEAFARDLEAVKAAASPEDYQALQSALSFIRFYEFGGAGNATELYQSLDGLTPRQIIKRGSK